MMPLPVTDGARLLGIHPKTLHHWLKEANLPLTPHPTDARIKCVMEEHLQQVASLHSRPLQASGPLDAASPPLVPAQVQALRVPESEGESACIPCSFPSPCASEADLRKTTGVPGNQSGNPSGAACSTRAGTTTGTGENS